MNGFVWKVNNKKMFEKMYEEIFTKQYLSPLHLFVKIVLMAMFYKQRNYWDISADE